MSVVREVFANLTVIQLFEFDILEPTIERGIIRTVSKTIPRIGALVNEPLETSSLEDVAEDAQSLVDGENAEAPALSIPTNGALHRGTGHVASTASVSHRVPNEILQHIYRYLPPKDVCNSYVIAMAYFLIVFAY